jgi:hypothetical protein
MAIFPVQLFAANLCGLHIYIRPMRDVCDDENHAVHANGDG